MIPLQVATRPFSILIIDIERDSVFQSVVLISILDTEGEYNKRNQSMCNIHPHRRIKQLFKLSREG